MENPSLMYVESLLNSKAAFQLRFQAVHSLWKNPQDLTFQNNWLLPEYSQRCILLQGPCEALSSFCRDAVECKTRKEKHLEEVIKNMSTFAFGLVAQMVKNLPEMWENQV